VQVQTGVKMLAAGTHQSLFIKSDGSLWATGYNDKGQLGDGTTVDKSTPVQINY
jgi:alpha-tubulin suppressor-like RCC1 family protein